MSVDSDSDGCDDFPVLSTDLDSQWNSGEDFKIPDAEVLYAERLRLDSQRTSTDDQQPVQSTESEEENTIETVEFPAEEFEETHKREPCILLNLDPLRAVLNASQIKFLDKFCGYFYDSNLGRKLSNVLISLEDIVQETEKWDEDNYIATCVILLVISTSELPVFMVSHICNARKLLYNLLEEGNQVVQINRLGKILLSAITKIEERLRLVRALEGAAGEHITEMSCGIITQCLREIFHGSSKIQWTPKPYHAAELIPPVAKIWNNLKFDNQYILAQLISKNFSQLKGDDNNNAVEYGNRNKLFSILNSKLPNELCLPDKLKLKILVSQMQMFQNKKAHSLLD